MSRIRRAVLPAALLLSATALVAGPAAAHLGDPNFRSVVREIVPPTEGLSARVIDHDDALLVINRSDRTVVIFDADREPFARLLADGTVQVDAEWAAEQAEEEAEAAEDAPEGVGAVEDGALLAHGGEDHSDDASGKGRGRGRGGSASGDDADRGTIAWTTLDRTGRFQWHDERINYREPGVPPQVSDRTEETKVKDWRVPIRVGGEGGAILGTLTWIGEPDAGSGFPTAAVVSIAALGLLGAGAVWLVRRRRTGG
jgi:MYXO-CTERM domain-containing protein